MLEMLLLSSNVLSGSIHNELRMLRSLEVLDVSRNILGGPIPASLGNCTHLSVLVLSSSPLTDHPHGEHRPVNECNAFVGSIPNEITVLPNLAVLWDHGTHIGGNLPSNWGACKHLSMVNLARNALLTGDISGRLDLNAFDPCLATFDASGNQLSIPVPKLSTNPCHKEKVAAPFNPTARSHLAHFKRSILVQHPLPLSENRNVIVHDQELRAVQKNESEQQPSRGSTLSPIATACILAGAGGIVILLASLIACCCLVKRRKRNPSEVEMIVLTNSRKVTLFEDIGLPLTYDTIVRATENVSRRHCIGRGGFGSTYQAEIAPENIVAVKRLAEDRGDSGEQQFKAEVNTLGRIRHPHLITLIGYYCNQGEMLLIYNYLPGGNLDRFIRDRDRLFFDWSILHKIAAHIASALVFLHDWCDPRILHRDIKPSNILLDSEYNAFLSDFGLSKIVTQADVQHIARVAGTYGYIAPEYAMTRQLSSKADVYSYGMVLLELMSDKRVLDPSFHGQGNGFDIVSWAMMMLNEGRAKEVFTAKLWEIGPRDKLVKMLHVAALCTVGAVVALPNCAADVEPHQAARPASRVT